MVIIMILINNDLNIEVKETKNVFEKTIGFMFKKNFNYGLMFRCNGIHTFFMKEEIDVVLADINNEILYIYPKFKKNRILLPKSNVYYTYEFPSNSINTLKTGDKMQFKSD